MVAIAYVLMIIIHFYRVAIIGLSCIRTLIMMIVSESII